MEGNFLTSGDLAMWEVRNRNYGYPYDGCGCGHGYHKNGMAATGIGLAAGLGGAALLGVLAIGWGVNQASKARARGNEKTADAIQNNIAQMSNLLLAERQSREAWQNVHAPTTTQYVDIRTGAFAGAGSNAASSALATAEANLLSGALTGQFARCPQEVTLVSKRNCPCPGECNG